MAARLVDEAAVDLDRTCRRQSLDWARRRRFASTMANSEPESFRRVYDTVKRGVAGEERG